MAMKWGQYGAVLEVNDFVGKYKGKSKKLEWGKEYSVLMVYSMPLSQEDGWRGYQFKVEYSYNREALFNPCDFHRGRNYIDRMIECGKLVKKDNM